MPLDDVDLEACDDQRRQALRTTIPLLLIFTSIGCSLFHRNQALCARHGFDVGPEMKALDGHTLDIVWREAGTFAFGELCAIFRPSESVRHWRADKWTVDWEEAPAGHMWYLWNARTWKLVIAGGSSIESSGRSAQSCTACRNPNTNQGTIMIKNIDYFIINYCSSSGYMSFWELILQTSEVGGRHGVSTRSPSKCKPPKRGDPFSRRGGLSTEFNDRWHKSVIGSSLSLSNFLPTQPPKNFHCS